MEDETAVSLMQRALARYDGGGEGTTLAACHFQARSMRRPGRNRCSPVKKLIPICWTSSRLWSD
jgi:hypothetical protein